MNKVPSSRLINEDSANAVRELQSKYDYLTDDWYKHYCDYVRTALDNDIKTVLGFTIFHKTCDSIIMSKKTAPEKSLEKYRGNFDQNANVAGHEEEKND